MIVEPEKTTWHGKKLTVSFFSIKIQALFKMAHKLTFILVLFFVGGDFIDAPGSQIFGKGDGRLIFRTGFEPDSRVNVRWSGNEEIGGIDQSVLPPNDWLRDLNGYPKIGFFNIQYQGGNFFDRRARIVDDPTQEGNQVLHFWLRNARVPDSGASPTGFKGRIQANIYDNNNFTEFYQKRRLYLHEDMNLLREFPDRFSWLTLEELWLAAGWIDHPYPFRIKVDLSKDRGPGQPLNFSVFAQKHIGRHVNVWSQTNREFEVPVAQWMTLETYYRQGDDQNGRFYFAVTPEGGERKVIFNITGWTFSPLASTPTPLTDWNPMKLYTSDTLVSYVRESGGVMQLYFDDWEIWDGPKPLVYENFSLLETGFQDQNSNWFGLENPEMIMIGNYEGIQGLTFETPLGQRGQLEHSFQMSDSVGEIMVRFTVRFPLSKSDNEGMPTDKVPAVHLLGGNHGYLGNIGINFLNDGFIKVETLDRQNNPLIVKLDQDRDDNVNRYHGGGAFDEFTELILTYDKVTGKTTLRGSLDSVSDDAFPGYLVQWQSLPGMEFDRIRLSSSSSSSTHPGGHSKNFSQIGEIGVFERPEIIPTIPTEFLAIPAVELRVNTQPGGLYFVEESNDLKLWSFVERFIGEGINTSRFYSPSHYDRKFYRVFGANPPD